MTVGDNDKQGDENTYLTEQKIPDSDYTEDGTGQDGRAAQKSTIRSRVVVAMRDNPVRKRAVPSDGELRCCGEEKSELSRTGRAHSHIHTH